MPRKLSPLTLANKAVSDLTVRLDDLKDEVWKYIYAVQTHDVRRAFSAVPYKEDGKAGSISTPELMAIILTGKKLGYDLTVKAASSKTDGIFDRIDFEFISPITPVPSNLRNKI